MTGAPDTQEVFAYGADPEFIKLRARRTVHVIGERDRPPLNVLGEPMTQAELLAYGPVFTRCGLILHQHRRGLQDNAHGIDAFPDEDLCRACYRAVPAAEHGRLFEHPQAVGDTDDEDT